MSIVMRNNKQDSTAAVSRFGRDKRARNASAEGVERSPRQRREADGDGYAQRGGEHPHGGRRASFNPNFSADNRLRDGGEQRSREPFREDRHDRPQRPESSQRFRSGRGENSSYGDRPFGGRQHRDGGHGPYGGRPASGRGGRGFDRAASGAEEERRPYRDSADRRGRNDGGRKGAGRGARAEQNPKRSYRADEKPGHYPRYAPSKMPTEMRLNRFLAQSGLCSRREADDYIQAGLVTVNGLIVTELGTKVKPSDEVRFNDERIQGEKKVYLVLNKPKGYVTSMEDPHADKTVMDLVKNACTERIYPVGRLDKNSVGLLLFTNDGDVASQLTHPSLEKKKIYQVTLDKPLTRADMERIAEGVTLEDGEVYADEIAYASENRKEVGIEIHSGRNRIVRRIFEHLGYSVQKLDRVYYAGITKKNLKRGAWRFLTREEVERLKSGRYE